MRANGRWQCSDAGCCSSSQGVEGVVAGIRASDGDTTDVHHFGPNAGVSEIGSRLGNGQCVSNYPIVT